MITIDPNYAATACAIERARQQHRENVAQHPDGDAYLNMLAALDLPVPATGASSSQYELVRKFGPPRSGRYGYEKIMVWFPRGLHAIINPAHPAAVNRRAGAVVITAADRSAR